MSGEDFRSLHSRFIRSFLVCIHGKPSLCRGASSSSSSSSSSAACVPSFSTADFAGVFPVPEVSRPVFVFFFLTEMMNV